MGIDPKVTALQDERMKWIGWVCCQWSYLEYLLLRTLAKLLNMDLATAKIVFGGLDMRPRISMASDLAKHLKSPLALRKGLAKVSKAIDDGLLKRRNRAIHGVQFIYADGEMRIEMHRGRERERKTLSSTELDSLTREIEAVGNEFCAVINRVLWKSDPPPYALLEKPSPPPRKKKTPKLDQKPKPRARQPRSSRT